MTPFENTAPWTASETLPTIDGSWYVRPESVPVRLAAGGIVVRWADTELMLALTRNKGGTVMALPKGGIDKGETAEQAARREIHEETGLERLSLLLQGPVAVHGRLGLGKRIWSECTWFLYLTGQEHAVPTDAAHSMSWHSYDLAGPLFWPGEQRLLQQQRHVVFELARTMRDPDGD